MLNAQLIIMVKTNLMLTNNIFQISKIFDQMIINMNLKHMDYKYDLSNNVK